MYLIIAEKSIAAKRIALILSDNKMETKKEIDYNLELYSFLYNNLDCIVIGLSGHIVGIDFEEKYQNWKDYNSSNLLNAKIVQTEINKNIILFLRKISKKISYVTIATDYDREGELIGVEALEIILKLNKNIKFDRALYSSITKKEILNSFSNLKNINFNLANAGKTREIVDLIWGAVLTRFISMKSGRLGNTFLSVGRVQSPTLALIVKKECEINSFIPSKYYEIKATFVNKNNEEFVGYYEYKKIKSSEDALEIYNSVCNVKKGIISEITYKTKEDNVPIPLNTTGFYVAAASIGFGINNARRIYQKLYELGYLSYPRTDSTIYPDSFDFKELIMMFLDTEFNDEAEKILKAEKLNPSRGNKIDLAHPPIHPVFPAEKKKLKDDEWKIYELVVRHFFSLFGSPTIWEKKKIKILVNNKTFNTNTMKIIDVGWRYFYNYNIPILKTIPDMNKNEPVIVKEVEIFNKETSPPCRYSYGKLLKEMEKLSLGTKSTRVDIINKLISRSYINNTPFSPTNIANAVINTLSLYSPSIVNSEMTKEMEIEMDKIAIGELKYEAVIKSSKKKLSKVIQSLEKNENNVIDSLKKGLLDDKIIGVCNKCYSNLLIRKSKKGLRFIGCSGYPNCNFSIPLPKSGKIIITDFICGIHNISHIKILTINKKTWDFGCPYCNFLNWNKK